MPRSTTSFERTAKSLIDECHHVSALSFESVLRESPAKYVLGLTATPIRRDGQQAVLFMQCGPTRYSVASHSIQPGNCAVEIRDVNCASQLPTDIPVQELFRELTTNLKRNNLIMSDVSRAYGDDRHVLLLSERADHVVALAKALSPEIPNLFCLHGRIGKRKPVEQLDALESLPLDSPRVLVATGKLIGESFDRPPLDTLILAHPISWKGTLQQYAGRLHRDAESKDQIRVLDYVNSHPIAQKMWNRRAAGYRAMGYQIIKPESVQEDIVVTAD